MSGFFGIVRTDGSAVEERFLQRVAQGLEFRGPDGSGFWRKDEVGFAFSFFDTGTRHQTQTQFVQLGGRYWFTGEVRLDARKELIAKLQDKGRPAGLETPDEELLLLGWSVWGEACLENLLGDFSFAIWDVEQRSLFCARDFIGARPFFYARIPGAFCFTNTLEVLHLVPGISSQLDDLFLRDFLLSGLSSDLRRTVWRDVRRLPAGHCLNFSDGNLEVKRFLRLPIEDPLHYKRPAEYLENFRELLQTAVADRSPEGKTALFLSGGLDSAAVCATAARIASQQGTLHNLKAFTISWRPLMNDPEPEFAKLTARHLGLCHQILEEARIVPFDGMNTQVTPEPTSEIFSCRDCRLYQLIGAHSRVVLSGDGGDDILEGEAWPYLQYLSKRAEWTEIARIFGRYFAAHGRIPPLRGGFRGRLLQSFRAKEVPNESARWLSDELNLRLRAHSAEVEEPAEPLETHPVHPRAYRSLHSGFWSSLLEQGDTGWTRIQLETRAPFLDLRLLRFLLQLPPVPWCMNKELTRLAMSTSLPVEILKRRKTPLLQDPLEVCRERPSWLPEIEKNPPKRIHEFVIWNDQLATLTRSYFKTLRNTIMKQAI